MRRQHTPRARDNRRTSTQTEQKVWRWLRDRYLSGYKFRRQHTLDRYILDFYCPELKLCIEIDGTSHDTTARAHYDCHRTRELAERGITVLRLRNDHILEQSDGAWALIVEAVEQAGRRKAEAKARRGVAEERRSRGEA